MRKPHGKSKTTTEAARVDSMRGHLMRFNVKIFIKQLTRTTDNPKLLSDYNSTEEN